MNRMPAKAALAAGVAVVTVAALSLLGSSAAGARPTVHAGSSAAAAAVAARAETPARSTARDDNHATRPWSFGIEADTQWTVADDGRNPNTCSVDIARQLDRQFIDKGVKFVVEVGDLCDDGSVAGEDTRAVFAQELYNAGIGFYPVSGNHDNPSPGELTKIYPQTQTAMMNETPASAFLTPNPDASTQPFPTPSGKPFRVGTISASPAAPDGLSGLSYAVDYRNARLVFLDQFATPSDPAHSVLTSADVDWMNAQLQGRPAGTQAFVFGHKGIITQNHVDTLFGNDPTADPSLQDTFISDLRSDGVHYYIGGHDHMYNRAVVASPDGKSSVQDIVSQSDASKFYIPYGSAGYVQRSVSGTTVSNTGTLAKADPTQTNDYIYDKLVAGGSTRETPIAQDLNKIGYFIVTVDGANVTIDYYAAVVNPSLSSDGSEMLLSTTPTMTFVKEQSFGYSLKGKEFFVPQGAPYTSVRDHFRGTGARIIGGVNGSVATDSAARSFTKDVTTGWAAPGLADRRLKSNILTLWGLADVGADHTDTYTLSMSSKGNLTKGAGFLVTRNAMGQWVNAVDTNVGGVKTFVRGPWKSTYGLGTYGVDRHTHTWWAVVNHAGEFAVAH